MKHNFFSLRAMLLASFVLASCNSKEIAIPDDGASDSSIQFEVSTVITKTANDGIHTTWTKDDAINLFHAEAGSDSYVNDNKFTVDEELKGVFSGELTSALEDGKSYDWYAFYPYNNDNKTPAGVDSETFGAIAIGGIEQTQTGNDSKAHLAGANCPLYGVLTGVVSSDKPAFAMNQLVSVVAVNVTNTMAQALTVSSVSFTSIEDIVGTYYIDFSGDAPVYKATGDSDDGSAAVSNTANLTVNEGAEIAKGESATFYIAVKPHSVASGSTLKVSVNGVEQTLTLAKDVTFKAGYIKTVKYTRTALELPFKEDFSAATAESDESADVAEFSKFISFANIYPAGNGILRVGTSDVAGAMTTVPLDLSKGATVILNVKKYGSDEPRIRITVNGVNYDMDSYWDGLSDYYDECEQYIPPVNVPASITITAQGDANERYLINDLRIISGRIPSYPSIEIYNYDGEIRLQFNDLETKSNRVVIENAEEVSCGAYDDKDGTVKASWCTAEYSDGQLYYKATSANPSATESREAYIIISAANSYVTQKAIIQLVQWRKY